MYIHIQERKKYILKFSKPLKAKLLSVNKAYENFFNGIEYPARSTVEVSELPMGALIEIECIAIK